ESRETEPAPTVAPPRRLYEYGSWRVVDRLCDERRLLRRCARCQTENEGSGSASISGIRPRRSGDESTLQGVCRCSNCTKSCRRRWAGPTATCTVSPRAMTPAQWSSSPNSAAVRATRGRSKTTFASDQVVSAAGDRLWYDYDFGDGWAHVLRVEEVFVSPPSIPRCIAGGQACPPEDCGGIGGYHELAEWVRSDFSNDLKPEVFADAGDGLRWLPDGWHPDAFDLDEVNERLAAAVAEPIPVV